MPANKPVVAIAGVSGDIGKKLLTRLKGSASIIALSNHADSRRGTEYIQWRLCDLFSLDDVEKGLAGADIAVYLCDSAPSSAKLSQASVEDMHAILADNVALAAKKQGIQKIIYWSKGVPENAMAASRQLEVEKILRAYGVPVKILKAAHKKTEMIKCNTLQVLSKGSQSNMQAIKKTVQSIQRIPLRAGYTAEWASSYYVKWLGKFLKPWIKTCVDEQYNCQVRFTFGNKPLLVLSFLPECSTPDRALYSISGGLMAGQIENVHSRMEFRKIPETDEFLVAIHDYVPSLPWFIYYYTQANVHLFVMERFKQHMRRKLE